MLNLFLIFFFPFKINGIWLEIAKGIVLLQRSIAGAFIHAQNNSNLEVNEKQVRNKSMY